MADLLTQHEIDQMILYGKCTVCGAARTVETMVSGDLSTHVTLVCSKSAGHEQAIEMEYPVYVPPEPPSIWDEPLLSIAEREAPLDMCDRACVYGECRASGSTMGCGGCCGCLGGCQAQWERGQTAPFVWTGDSA